MDPAQFTFQKSLSCSADSFLKLHDTGKLYHPLLHGILTENILHKVENGIQYKLPSTKKQT